MLPLMLYIVLVTITQSEVIQLAPLIVIMILIVAAAGLTRGADLFSLFGIGALMGFTGSIGGKGAGKGFTAANVRVRSQKGFKGSTNVFKKLGGSAQKKTSAAVKSRWAASRFSAAGKEARSSMASLGLAANAARSAAAGKGGMTPMAVAGAAGSRSGLSTPTAARQKLALQNAQLKFLQGRRAEADMKGGRPLSSAEKSQLTKLEGTGTAGKVGSTALTVGKALPIIGLGVGAGALVGGAVASRFSTSANAERERKKEQKEVIRRYESTMTPAQRKEWHAQIAQAMKPGRPSSKSFLNSGNSPVVASFAVAADAARNGVQGRRDALAQKPGMLDVWRSGQGNPGRMGGGVYSGIRDENGNIRKEFMNANGTVNYNAVQSHAMSQFEQNRAAIVQQAAEAAAAAEANRESLRAYTAGRLGLADDGKYKSKLIDLAMAQHKDVLAAMQLSDRANDQMGRDITQKGTQLAQSAREAGADVAAAKAAHDIAVQHNADDLQHEKEQLADARTTLARLRGEHAQSEHNVADNYDAVMESPGAKRALGGAPIGSEAEERAVYDGLSAQIGETRNALLDQQGKLDKLKQGSDEIAKHASDAADVAHTQVAEHSDFAEKMGEAAEGAHREMLERRAPAVDPNDPSVEHMIQGRINNIAQEKQDIADVIQGAKAEGVPFPDPLQDRAAELDAEGRRMRSLETQNNTAYTAAQRSMERAEGFEGEALRMREAAARALRDAEKEREKAERDAKEIRRKAEEAAEQLRARNKELEEIAALLQDRIRQAQNKEHGQDKGLGMGM